MRLIGVFVCPAALIGIAVVGLIIDFAGWRLIGFGLA